MREIVVPQNRSMNAVRASRIPDWRDAPGFESEWERLLDRADGGSVFQTLSWHRSWWEAFGAGHELLLVLAHAGRRLVGVAPMLIEGGARPARVHFIGSTNHASDYCDLIVDPEFPGAVAALLDAVCDAAAPLQRIDLSHLPAASPNRARVLEFLAGRGLHCRSRVEQLAPARRLDDPAADRRAADKQSLKRHTRHFRKAGELSFVRLDEGDAVLGRLDAFFEQHIARWARTPTPSQFHDPAQRLFYRALVRNLLPPGWLKFDVLSWNGEPLAFHLGFEYRRRFIWYKPTFDVRHAAHSPGEVLIKHLLEDAIDRRLEEFDFTVGAEPFKLRFANVIRRIERVTAFASPADYWRDGIVAATRTAWRRMRGRDPAAAGLTSARV